jgi:hypothetical protein
MSGRTRGSTIGAVAGLVFILVNAGSLPDGVAVVVRGLGVLAFVAVLALVVRHRGSDQPPSRPDELARRTYWAMVGFEAVLLPAGSIALTRTGYPELGVAWVALIVGVHFLPFAKAFAAPDFRTLGWTMIVLGLVGGVLAVSVSAASGAVVAGVLSGAALFAFSMPLRPASR